MGDSIEIERRFLLNDDSWRNGSVAEKITQVYLCVDPQRVIRVRMTEKQAQLTLKSDINGLSRHEFEYTIPLEHASIIADIMGLGVVEKRRYGLWVAGLFWEIDEFLGANQGLLLAEVELKWEDQDFLRPSWVGEEVTHDHRYSSAYLSCHPYIRWPCGVNNDRS